MHVLNITKYKVKWWRSAPREGPGGITYPTWPGERLRVPQEELESVAGEKEAWNTLLKLLLAQPEVWFSFDSVLGSFNEDYLNIIGVLNLNNALPDNSNSNNKNHPKKGRLA